MVISESDQIEAIWTNDNKGNFIYSNPPAGIANATVRDWFNESMKGTTYVSNIYISAISKSPCMTISLPIYNTSRQVIGVIGADIGIHYQ
jgi:methyl-accepting chemotaxis protein